MVNLIHGSFRVELFLFEQSEPGWICWMQMSEAQRFEMRKRIGREHVKPIWMIWLEVWDSWRVLERSVLEGDAQRTSCFKALSWAGTPKVLWRFYLNGNSVHLNCSHWCRPYSVRLWWLYMIGLILAYNKFMKIYEMSAFILLPPHGSQQIDINAQKRWGDQMEHIAVICWDGLPGKLDYFT